MTTEPSSAKDEVSASPQERFEVLYDTLQQFHAGLIEFEFKHGAFLFLILGWLLTAEKAQLFLKDHPSVRCLLILSIIGLTTFHSIWVYRHYRSSTTLHRLLSSLRYVPDEYLEARTIAPFLVVTFCISHLLLSLVICFVAWSA
jgi:hypothetical protein